MKKVAVSIETVKLETGQVGQTAAAIITSDVSVQTVDTT